MNHGYCCRRTPRRCDPSRRVGSHREKAFSLADKCFDLNQRALEVTRNRGLAGDFQVSFLVGKSRTTGKLLRPACLFEPGLLVAAVAVPHSGVFCLREDYRDQQPTGCNPDSNRCPHQRLQHPRQQSFSQRFRGHRDHDRRHCTLRWLNPNAPANWLADVEKWRMGLGVTKEHLSCEMGFWNVEGSSAYAVISGTLTVTIKGQSVVRTGTLAYTFANHDGAWKVEAQAWGRTS